MTTGAFCGPEPGGGRFLKDIEGLFVRVLELAREMNVLKLGTVALDGTKILANASRHSADVPSPNIPRAASAAPLAC